MTGKKKLEYVTGLFGNRNLGRLFVHPTLLRHKRLSVSICREELVEGKKNTEKVYELRSQNLTGKG